MQTPGNCSSLADAVQRCRQPAADADDGIGGCHQRAAARSRGALHCSKLALTEDRVAAACVLLGPTFARFSQLELERKLRALLTKDKEKVRACVGLGVQGALHDTPSLKAYVPPTARWWQGLPRGCVRLSGRLCRLRLLNPNINDC
jgi:hypothetical protein